MWVVVDGLEVGREELEMATFAKPSAKQSGEPTLPWSHISLIYCHITIIGYDISQIRLHPHGYASEQHKEWHIKYLIDLEWACELPIEMQNPPHCHHNWPPVPRVVMLNTHRVFSQDALLTEGRKEVLLRMLN
jgi:hypothetical protein